MGAPIYLAIPVMLVLGVAQASILPRFPILGVSPQLLFLVALAWGDIRGLEEGLIWAFIAGLFADLFSLAPLGISSLAFMAGAGLPLTFSRLLPPNRRLIIVLMAAAGTVIYLAFYMVTLRIFGYGVSFGGLVELLPLVGLHAVLIFPIHLFLSTILRAFQPRRVEL